MRKLRRRPNRRRRLRPPPKRPPRPRLSSRIRLPDSRTRPRIRAVRHRVVAPAVACRTSFQAAVDTAVQMIVLRPLRTV